MYRDKGGMHVKAINDVHMAEYEKKPEVVVKAP